MKKSSVRKFVRRVTAGFTASMLVLSCSVCIFADESAANSTSKIEVTEWTEKVIGTTKSSGKIGYVYPEAYCDLYKDGVKVEKTDGTAFANLTGDTVYVKGNAQWGDAVKPINTWSSEYLNMSECYKWSVGFDLKTTEDTTDGSLLYFDKNQGRLGFVYFTKNTVKFVDRGNESNTATYSFKTGDWVNIKCVVYPVKENEGENFDRIEWYADGKLMLVASTPTTLSNPANYRILDRISFMSGQNFYFTNVELKGIKLADAMEHSEKLNVLGISDKTAQSPLVKVNENATATDDDGIAPTGSGIIATVKDNVLDYGTNKTPMFGKYSFSFDIKTTREAENNDKIATFYFRDNVYHYNGTEENYTGKDVGYMGIIDVYGKHLQFSVDGTWSFSPNVVTIEDNKWYNIEYVIEPSSGDFSWYVDGKSVVTGSVADSTHWCASNNRILSTFRLNADSSTSFCDGDIYVDNMKLSAITDTAKETVPFKAEKLEKTAKGFKISFNREIGENTSILDDIEIFDGDGEKIAVESFAVGSDKKSVEITGDNTGSVTYSAKIPERFMSADGYAVSDTTVGEKSFSVTDGKITVTGQSASLSAKYVNTTGADVKLLTLIASYDSENILSEIKYESKTVYTGVDNQTADSKTLTVNVPTGGSVKAFVWDASSYAPKCEAIIKG